MDAAIACTPVQICDVNLEQPTDLFCTKSLTSFDILEWFLHAYNEVWYTFDMYYGENSSLKDLFWT